MVKLQSHQTFYSDAVRNGERRDVSRERAPKLLIDATETALDSWIANWRSREQHQGILAQNLVLPGFRLFREPQRWKTIASIQCSQHWWNT